MMLGLFILSHSRDSLILYSSTKNIPYIFQFLQCIQANTPIEMSTILHFPPRRLRRVSSTPFSLFVQFIYIQQVQFQLYLQLNRMAAQTMTQKIECYRISCQKGVKTWVSKFRFKTDIETPKLEKLNFWSTLIGPIDTCNFTILV